MSSELDLLQTKIENAVQARKIAEQNLEQKSLEIYNLKQDLSELEETVEEERAKAIGYVKADLLFSKNINEEIRNPLNAILGMTQLLEESDLNDTQAEQLKLIKGSAEILNTMLTDTLDFSRSEPRSSEVSHIKFDVVQLMESILKTISMQLDGVPISVRLEMDSGFDKLLAGDSVILRNILLRIIKFSRRNTREGYIYLRTRIIDRDRERISVRFEIEDTGIGIEKEKLNTIFEPYQPLYSNDVYSQEELGLPYVKKLIEVLEGDIHVSSRMGTGTKFSILLNFEETQESMRVAIPQVIASNEDIVLSAPILLVEDSLLHQEYMANLFAYWGCNFVIAESCVKAIELARTKAFSIIFLDMHMPKMNGAEVSRAIRKFGNVNSSIPIIAMSSSTSGWILEEALELGIVHLLTKPFHPNKVHQILSEIAEVKTEVKEKNVEPSRLEEELIADNGGEQAKQEEILETKEIVVAPEARTSIKIDTEYLQQKYENADEAYDAFKTYLDKTPSLLNDIKYCERLSQVSKISQTLIPIFQDVGLGSFTNEFNMLIDLAQTNQYTDLNEKVDSLLENSEKAIEVVRTHYEHIKSSNSLV